MLVTNYKLILASNSPRRKELLKGLDLDYEVRLVEDSDESYSEDIPLKDVAEFLAVKKAKAACGKLGANELVICADTIVLNDDVIYGKPTDKSEAVNMLSNLSGKTHMVITGVCLAAHEKQISFSSITEVTFGVLTAQEIEYYVDNYLPFDKAGAYGIQDWIGFVGVKRIEGSYHNVMGLPVYRVYEELKKF